jgi:hypothetical protein
MSPTLPPYGKCAKENKKEKEIETINKPIVTYFRFRQIEKTLRSKRRLIPTTKKKVQNKNDANPKPL